MKKNIMILGIVSWCVLSFSTLYASASSDIEFILGTTHTPIGIIFEVDQSNEVALQWAIPKIQAYMKQLHEKFPTMKMALVTHGKEQFSLLSEKKSVYPQIHQAIQHLVKTNVPVHICGTHASWFNKSGVDFPDYVDVPESGPEQIKVYQRQGYALVTLDQL